MAAALSSTAFASGGNNPVPGIDIIIKEAGIQSSQEPYSFGDKELKAVNAVKGFERPARIAGYAAQYAHKQAEGAAPKGGWDAVLKEGLIADWNVDERGGSTAIKVMTLEPKANYIVTIRVHSEAGETLKWSRENGAITLPSTALSEGNLAASLVKAPAGGSEIETSQSEADWNDLGAISSFPRVMQPDWADQESYTAPRKGESWCPPAHCETLEDADKFYLAYPKAEGREYFVRVRKTFR